MLNQQIERKSMFWT